MSTDLVQANTTLTTVPVEETPELPAPQVAALDALLSGKSIIDAAAAAGVSRRTVYTWQRDNCRFQAALNQGRRDLHRSRPARRRCTA